MTKIALCSIVAISSALAAISTGVNRTYSNSIINGDLLGAAHVTCTTPRSEDVSNTIEINPSMNGNSNMSGTGVYFRIKNYTAIETPLTVLINSTNGSIIAPTTNVKQTYYDINGVEVSGSQPRNWGNYMMLPANFDGFIYMNYNTQMTKTIGDSDFVSSSIWRIYVNYSGQYDSYANYAIGDIFTDTTNVLDTSTLDSESFNSVFINQDGSKSYQEVVQLARSEEDKFIPDGDFKGGISVDGTAGYGGFMMKFGTLLDFSDGFYVRIKNLKTSSTWLMIHAASDWFKNRSINLASSPVYLYETDGTTKTEKIINEWGYFELPANFDGYLNIPISSLTGDTSWAGSAYNASTTNAIYFEADGLNVQIGDIFTKTLKGFDGSEIYATDLVNIYETWTGFTYTVLEGSKEVPVELFDYSTIEYDYNIENGVKITASKNADSSAFSSAIATFATPLDLSNGEAISISFKGIGNYAFGLEFYDSANNYLQMPDAKDSATKPIYFISNGNATTMNHTTGDANTIHTVAGEGNIVIQKDFLKQKKGESFLWNEVKGFVVSVHTYYDNGINVSFGDIGYVDQTSLTQSVVYTTSEHEYSNVYSTTDEYVRIEKVFTPLPSSWIGDVKIIDSLNYKDDATLKENVTYDIGDNACSYNKENDGMFVHIGPFETGHTYGNYMCLGMFDKGLTTDRKVAYRMNNENKEYAKGITFYAENRSVKEIGLTLQFDENIPNSNVTERWCVTGYPAMYYAYDVEKDCDYLMYAKSDQVQIPVGFKGYIRVPFTSYSVPEWNAGLPGVDQVLDLDNFSGNFFLTSDNTRFEDLEYFIKNVGLYFNETRTGNFLSKENTIKSNMGLGE